MKMVYLSQDEEGMVGIFHLPGEPQLGYVDWMADGGVAIRQSAEIEKAPAGVQVLAANYELNEIVYEYPHFQGAERSKVYTCGYRHYIASDSSLSDCIDVSGIDMVIDYGKETGVWRLRVCFAWGGVPQEKVHLNYLIPNGLEGIELAFHQFMLALQSEVQS